MITSKHTLSHCKMCGDNVICATCDNNCCNGGYGGLTKGKIRMPDEECCPDCPEAYEHQDAFWKNPNSVVFAHDIRKNLESK